VAPLGHSLLKEEKVKLFWDLSATTVDMQEQVSDVRRTLSAAIVTRIY
jgi:hypothetical protein